MSNSQQPPQYEPPLLVQKPKPLQYIEDSWEVIDTQTRHKFAQLRTQLRAELEQNQRVLQEEYDEQINRLNAEEQQALHEAQLSRLLHAEFLIQHPTFWSWVLWFAGY